MTGLDMLISARCNVRIQANTTWNTVAILLPNCSRIEMLSMLITKPNSTPAL